MDVVASHLRVGYKGIGLANQLYDLFNAILVSVCLNKRYLILEEFNVDYEQEKYVSIETVIDIYNLNAFTKPLGVSVILKRDFTIKISHAIYTDGRLSIDMSDIFTMPLSIFRNLDMNNIRGDPSPGIPKYLYVHGDICGEIFIRRFEEHGRSDVNWSSPHVIPQSNRPNLHTPLFNLFFKALRFAIADIYTPIFLSYKANLIHIRFEDDALKNWARINKMTVQEFSARLSEKYINAIKYSFRKDLTVIVLCADEDNTVIRYMRDNRYDVVMSPYKFKGQREINAIADLLAAKKCENCAILACDPVNHTGSTYSLLLDTVLPDSVNRVYIDLDHI